MKDLFTITEYSVFTVMLFIEFIITHYHHYSVFISLEQTLQIYMEKGYYSLNSVTSHLHQILQTPPLSFHHP